MMLVAVCTRSRRGFYVMDAGRRIRFYPWREGKPSAPLSRQRVEEALLEEKERILDETFSDWASLRARVDNLLGLKIGE